MILANNKKKKGNRGKWRAPNHAAMRPKQVLQLKNNNKDCRACSVKALCEAAEVGECGWVKAGDVVVVVVVGEFENNNKNSSEQQQLSGRGYKPKHTPGQERTHHKRTSHETSNKTVRLDKHAAHNPDKHAACPLSRGSITNGTLAYSLNKRKFQGTKSIKKQTMLSIF